MAQEDELIILIAEDDDGHAELIRENLRDAGLQNEIIRFADGQELWDYLNCVGPESHIVLGKQYLLLLDIRMPRMDGVEVLQRIKSTPVLQKIPVIMLTTTDDPREIGLCYEYGCNCYITKPVDFASFSETLRRMGLFVLVIKVANLDKG